MKLDLETLECTVLKHLITSPTAVNRARQLKIKEEHFAYTSDASEKCYTARLFRLIENYYDSSGGSLVTRRVLEDKLVKQQMDNKQRGKYLTLWEKIDSQDYDENELHYLLVELKTNYCLRLWRSMLKEGHETLTNNGLDDGLAYVQSKLDQIVFELDETGQEQQRIDVSEAAEYFAEEYTKRKLNPDMFRGIMCGVEEIDSRTFGWMPGQLIVLLAPSSGGKSVQLLNWSNYAHQQQGKNILYFSFEMDLWQCLLRHLALAYEVPYAELKSLGADDDVIKNLIDRLKLAAGGAYFEYDVSLEDPTPEYVDSRIRELIQTKGKPDLVVIDYMGNMKTRSSRRDAKPWEQQGDAFERLHVIAKRYQIPILTAQQINRDTIRETRKRREEKKAMQYWQDAASGDQRLMHLSHFVIGLEPFKEEGFVTYHPVKMRDAWFPPCGAKWDNRFNLVRDLTPEEQNEWRQIAQLNGSIQPDKTDSKDALNVTQTPDGTTVTWQGGSETIDPTELEIDATDWGLDS